MDRTTNSSSTTPGTAAHLVSTSGSMYYLLLLSRGAYSTLAQQASRRLCDLVTQRIRTQAMALVALQGIDNSEVDAEVLRLLQEATPVVLSALTAYRPRNPYLLAGWLDRRIDHALRSEPLDGPPSATVPLRAALALEPLPIPQGDRHAVLAAILRMLPTPERRVLQYRAEPRASWTRVAQSMGMTLAAVRALHRLALERAQRLAFELMQQPEAGESIDIRRAA